MINEKNYADKIDQHLNDLDRLQILSDNIYRKVAKDYEAEKRFTGFISFIDNHLKDYHNSGRYLRRSCSRNEYEIHIRRGEVFYYSFFRSICIENKDSRLLERSIEEFEKAIDIKVTPRGMTDLAIAKSSYVYLYETDKIKQTKVKEIIIILEDVISSNPEYALAHFNLGLTLMRAGKSIEALKTFVNTLELFNNQDNDIDPWCLYSRDHELFNKIIRKPMNANFIKLSAVAIAFSMGVAISPAYSQGQGKGKGKIKQNLETKVKHGREAGELPFGIERYSEKKGGLPSGLEKKETEDGSLTRGLEEGGKRLESKGKAKKGSK